MKPTALISLTTVLLALIAAPLCGDDTKAQQPQTLDRTIKAQMGYLLYLPQDYDSKDAWPLMVFLHGVGERGTNLEAVKVHGPPKLIEAGKQFPMIVVSPNAPVPSGGNPSNSTHSSTKSSKNTKSTKTASTSPA